MTPAPVPTSDPPAPQDAAADGRPWWKRVPGPAWGLAALAVGMTLGAFFPTELSPIGEGVKNGFGYIAKAAPYIIFLTLTPAILDMMRTGSAAKFALYVTTAFFVSAFLAAVFALLLVAVIFQLDFGTSTGNLESILHTVAEESVASLGSPPFIAVGYSIAIALLLHFGAKTRLFGWFCGPTADVYHVVGTKGISLVGKAMKIAFPAILFAIGVFIPTGITRNFTAGQSSIESADIGFFGSDNPIVAYFVALGVTVLILFGFLGLLTYAACRITGFSFKRFVKDYLLYVYPFAWATASSTASIPINVERAEKGLGVRSEVREFIIPLGATVNLDGTMIAIYVLSVVAGIVVGYPPTILQLLILTIPLSLAIHGVPGIPGGVAAVAPPLIVSFLSMPVEAQPVFIAVWVGFSIGLNDQFRSGVNSCTNGVISLLFHHYYPKYFEKKGAAVSVPVQAGSAEVSPAVLSAEAPAGPK